MSAGLGQREPRLETLLSAGWHPCAQGGHGYGHSCSNEHGSEECRGNSKVRTATEWLPLGPLPQERENLNVEITMEK